MKSTTIAVDDYLYEFYRKVGEQAGGISAEKIMADALFKLAVELSLNAIRSGRNGQDRSLRLCLDKRCNEGAAVVDGERSFAVAQDDKKGGMAEKGRMAEKRRDGVRQFGKVPFMVQTVC